MQYIKLYQWLLPILGGVIATLLTYFAYPYMRKRAEDIAARKSAKDMEYQREKGKNAATKEDIKEITEKIEEVKSEISFANQRKYEKIVELEKCLLDIAYYSNLIGNMGSMLYAYHTNQSDRTKVDKFLEDLNGYQANLIYCKCRATISIEDEDMKNTIEILIKHMSAYSAELSAKAANAGQIMDTCERCEKNMDLFSFSDDQKIEMMNFISEKKDELREIQDEPIKSKTDYLNAVSAYLKALRKHYNTTNLF